MDLNPEWAPSEVPKEQNTNHWLRWRHRGIGSSDAAVVMGVSPWKSPRQLWEEKRVPLEIPDTLERLPISYIQERGKETEPLVREWYEEQVGLKAPPVCMQADDFPFMKASLDGFVLERERLVEIKLVGKEDYALSLAGKIPHHYWVQLQHGMRVSNANHAHYCFAYGTAYKFTHVARDDVFISLLIEKEIEFWNMVENNIPPPYTDLDDVPIEEDDVLFWIDEWKKLKLKMEADQIRADRLREDIQSTVELLGHKKMIGRGVRIQKISKQGAVDYRRIPELKNIDLEQYRKPGSEYFMFKEMEE